MAKEGKLENIKTIVPDVKVIAAFYENTFSYMLLQNVLSL
jgi:hypothetical protein